MDSRERIKVDLAVKVLRQAMSDRAPSAGGTDAVRFALRVLWPHCGERWPLVCFWDSGQQGNDIGQVQSMTAAFNGIVRQLRQSGAWSDAEVSRPKARS